MQLETMIHAFFNKHNGNVHLDIRIIMSLFNSSYTKSAEPLLSVASPHT